VLPGDVADSHPNAHAPWHAYIITLFPRILSGWLDQGVVSRAVERGLARIELVDLRTFGIGRHATTDDYPFGGGAGMVMKPEPLFAAVESLDVAPDAPIILLSPRGRRFDQAAAAALAGRNEIALIAGHYEGVDERVRRHLATDEISIGDYVLSCGELAAMVVTDAIVRLLPGAIREGAVEEESFTRGLLEYPQYTRPAKFRGWEVPQVLLSGHHGEVERWRRRQSLLVTAEQRPDLLKRASLSEEELRLLQAEGYDEERGSGPE
jgi:tRNA (guanine37-N1)-methyltransferase